VTLKKHTFKIAIRILALPRIAKRILALAVDIGACVISVWLSYYLRLGEFISFTGQNELEKGVVWASVTSIVIALPIFILMGMYRAIFRFNGGQALMVVARSVGLYGILYSFIFTFIGMIGVPRTLGIIQPVLLLMLVGASRGLVRVLLGDHYLLLLRKSKRQKVLVYGAGYAGRQLVAALSNTQEIQVVGFLDDDERLIGRSLNGLTIYCPSDLVDLVSTLSIKHVLLAMPSLQRKRRNEIINKIRSSHVSVRTLPDITLLTKGQVNFSNLRDLEVDDLLGRDPVKPIQSLLEKNIRNKIVLVTGAGGSIGSELCRQIIYLGPTKLLLVEQSEFALYEIYQEIKGIVYNHQNILFPLIASVQDKERMHEIMAAWHPDTVYHVAAYKHVPLVEQNPSEGIKNNAIGTLCVAKVSAENGVADFVLISTDKAVRPSNIMGASKRLAEMILQALGDVYKDTKFSIVRFGNVLDSSGSVVPRFRQQILDGGPITLTHPDITRYIMTIPEAVQLVIQAGAMAEGGDVFILEMGQPVKIMDLARNMIELSGMTLKNEENPLGDIEIEIIGLRAGEKLYEELMIVGKPMPTAHIRIFKVYEEFMPWDRLKSHLNTLETAVSLKNNNLIRSIMQEIVSGYAPNNEIADLVYLQQK